jgi:hypothetical protein
MTALFGTSMTGSNLQYELMTGSYERILATPLSRSSLMIGRALKEWAPLVVQGLLISVVCIPFGLVLYPLHVLFGFIILGIFGVGLGALSYSLALVSQNKEWIFWGVQQTLLFPLMILSGIMLPIEAGPEWMRVAGLFNPLTHLGQRRTRTVRGRRRREHLLGPGRRRGDRRRRTRGGHPGNQPKHELEPAGPQVSVRAQTGAISVRSRPNRGRKCPFARGPVCPWRERTVEAPDLRGRGGPRLPRASPPCGSCPRPSWGSSRGRQRSAGS